jgi:hypothetical protein
LEKAFVENELIRDWALNGQVSLALMVGEKLYDGRSRFAVPSVGVVSFPPPLFVSFHPNHLFRFLQRPALACRTNVHLA